MKNMCYRYTDTAGPAEPLRYTGRPEDRIAAHVSPRGPPPVRSAEALRAEYRSARGLLRYFGGQVGRKMAHCLRRARVALRAAALLRLSEPVESVASLRTAQSQLGLFGWWAGHDPAGCQAARAALGAD